jgi:hypothetical protein
MYNGLHIDPLAPSVLSPLLEFYDLYVAERAPIASPILNFVIGAGTTSFFGAALDVPESDLQGLDYATALAAYEAEDPIRVLYEVGAEQPNLPQPRFVESFDSWPIEETTVLGFSLGEDGVLDKATDPPGDNDEPTDPTAAIASFVGDPSEGSQLIIEPGEQIWGAMPNWRWPLAEPSNRARFLTAEFDDTVVLTGTAVAALRVQLPDGEPDADLEITLSDLSPDGSETFIQSGWLRLSRRVGAQGNSELNHRISNREPDIRPLDVGEVAEASIGILPFAHVFRTGHRLAATVDTPGASRAEWAFDVIPDPIRVEILAGSELRLPQIELDFFDPPVPEGSPACGSLRAQPCRPG